MTARDARRCLPVRLTEIRPEVRHSAARVAAQEEPEVDGKIALIVAALYPSSAVYYVARSAAQLLARVRA